jgi:hypothetical protein
MIRVDITKNQVVTNSASLDNQNDANSWIAQEVANNSWGRPVRQVSSEDLLAMSKENIGSATSSQQETDLQGNPYTLYTFPADYTIVQTDLGNSVLLAQVRAQRDALLTACDWTQLSDSPLVSDKKASWATYRQQLRDLPDQQGFDPTNFSWPTQPS